MDELVKKLSNIRDLIKAIKASTSPIQSIPAIKPPSPPSMTPKANTTKMPGVNPNSKKDPRKVAQQIKDGSMSTKTQKIMFKNEPWSEDDIKKADENAEQRLYHIHQGPHRITSKPVDLNHVRKQYGSVQRLENSGFRLIPHVEKPKEEVNKVEAQKPNPKDPALNPDKFAPKAISPEKLKEQQAKLDQYLKNKKDK